MPLVPLRLCLPAAHQNRPNSVAKQPQTSENQSKINRKSHRISSARIRSAAFASRIARSSANGSTTLIQNSSFEIQNEFTILNTQFIILNTEFIIFNTKSNPDHGRRRGRPQLLGRRPLPLRRLRGVTSVVRPALGSVPLLPTVAPENTSCLSRTTPEIKL